jgi:hypothetical protein
MAMPHDAHEKNIEIKLYDNRSLPVYLKLCFLTPVLQNCQAVFTEPACLLQKVTHIGTIWPRATAMNIHPPSLALSEPPAPLL